MNIGDDNRDGDRVFWSEAIIKYYDVLLRYSLRLTNGDESRARDLVQQIAMRIFYYLPRPTAVRQTKYFLIRSVRNYWIKSRQRIKEIGWDQASEEIAKLPGFVFHPQDQTNLELMQIVDEVRQELTLKFGDFEGIFKMRLLGFTCPEINKALGLNPGVAEARWGCFVSNVRKRLSRRNRNDDGVGGIN